MYVCMEGGREGRSVGGKEGGRKGGRKERRKNDHLSACTVTCSIVWLSAKLWVALLGPHFNHKLSCDHLTVIVTT